LISDIFDLRNPGVVYTGICILAGGLGSWAIVFNYNSEHGIDTYSIF
jgi:hypothetical protein